MSAQCKQKNNSTFKHSLTLTDLDRGHDPHFRRKHRHVCRRFHRRFGRIFRLVIRRSFDGHDFVDVFFQPNVDSPDRFFDLFNGHAVLILQMRRD